jgi:hypothetical protein
VMGVARAANSQARSLPLPWQAAYYRDV